MYTLDKLDAPSISPRQEFSGDRKILELASYTLSCLDEEERNGFDDITLAKRIEKFIEESLTDPTVRTEYRWSR